MSGRGYGKYYGYICVDNGGNKFVEGVVGNIMMYFVDNGEKVLWKGL